MSWSLLMKIMQQLFPVAVQGVQIVEEATGKSPEDAIKEVIDHLTPGAPLSPALGGTAETGAKTGL